jgi:hypothetical protein
VCTSSNHALADANEHGWIACIRAVACLKFKKRAKSLRIKNAFDFNFIDAKRGGAGGGICRSIAYFMSDSLTNRAMHKKRSVAYLRVLGAG